jgi:cytochrome c peroxidase
MKCNSFLIALILSILFVSCSDENEYSSIPNDKIALGKLIFNDSNLSNPIGQACASCHSPETGFSDPMHNIVSEGAVHNAFGNRNAPSLAYNVFAPNRYYNTIDETFIGGFFLDGRSPNLQEQMIHPLLNPVEMNNASKAQIVTKIKAAAYYPQIVALYSNSPFDDDILSYVADALMNFETSNEVNSFTSKYDYYLQGRATLNLQEKKGLVLFNGKAKCALCHVSDPDPIQKKVLFTDFSYDNLGIPKNPNNPFYSQPSNSLGLNYIDFGIGAIVNQSIHNGKFKVPSLRNVAISAPYFHNGSILTLEKVVRFYNRRDLNTGEFALAEVSQNVNVEELGNLGLTDEEEQNLIAFLKTLTDGYHK